MPDLSKLSRIEVQEPVLWSGEIATDPADTTDPVMVRIPAKDEGVYEYGPCPWEPRIVDGDEYGIPSTGDRALIALDEKGDPWIVMWWPYD
jgi:hypothetical protein